MYFLLLFWNWKYQETKLELLKQVQSGRKIISSCRKKVGHVKNTSEGQQQALGKALYIYCRRYVEKENEKVNKYYY